MMVGADESMLRLLNELAQWPLVASLARLFSSAAVPVAICLPILGRLLHARRYRAAIAIVVAMGSGDAVTARILKPAFARPRPCHNLEGLVAAAPCGTGKSFPSGHATVAFAFLAVVAPVLRRGLQVAVALVAMGVALSRVVLGVHYPSDVVAGALVGFAIGFVTHRAIVGQGSNRTA